MARGEFALAQQLLVQGVENSFDWAGEHDLYAMLADIAVQRRDQSGLQRYAPLAEENAARYNHSLYLAIAKRAWGVLYSLEGKYQEAEESLFQALKLFQELDTLWQIGRTLYELGDLARHCGDLKTSREHFEGALAAFNHVQAVPDAARIRQSIAEL